MGVTGNNADVRITNGDKGFRKIFPFDSAGLEKGAMGGALKPHFDFVTIHNKAPYWLIFYSCEIIPQSFFGVKKKRPFARALWLVRKVNAFSSRGRKEALRQRRRVPE